MAAGKVHPTSLSTYHAPTSIHQPRRLLVTQQAGGDPRHRDRAVRARRLRAQQVGGRRDGRRDRLDGALPLLRVQAPLPLRDHGRGARRGGRAVRPDHGRARGLRRGAGGRAPGGVRPVGARSPAQPAARLRAGSGRGAPHVRARGGGAAARARAHARPRVQVGRVPDARDGAGRDPRSGAAPARPGAPRALQQRVPLVPPARRARPLRGRRLLRAALSRRRRPAAAGPERRGRARPSPEASACEAFRPRPARGSAASRAGRSPCGGPRRARRRSGGCARRRRARRADGPGRRPRRRAPGSRGR